MKYRATLTYVFDDEGDFHVEELEKELASDGQLLFELLKMDDSPETITVELIDKKEAACYPLRLATF